MVACAEQEGLGAGGIEAAHRRPAEEAPARGPGDGIDVALLAADADRAARDVLARLRQAGRVQDLGLAAEIGEARREADHEDAVVGPGMECDQLFGREALHAGHLLKILPHLAAVEAGDPPEPARRRRERPGRDLEKPGAEVLRADAFGVVAHEKRAVGRHDVEDAREVAGPRGLLDSLRKRDDAGIGLGIDAFADLDGEGAVAAGKKAGGHRHGIILISG